MSPTKFNGKNPWLSIWVKPRSTIAAIVKYNPKYRLWILSALSGLPMLLQFSQTFMLGKTSSILAIFVIAVLLSFLVGIINITVWSALCFWTGKWIGGKSSFSNVRTAVAWSNVPHVVTVVLWLGLALVYKGQLFNGEYVNEFVVWKELFLVGTGFIQLICSIWSLVILVNGLAQVQGFSGWKGILNMLLPILLVIAAAWIFMDILMWSAKGMTA